MAHARRLSTADDNARTRAIERVVKHALAYADEKDRPTIRINAYIARDGVEIRFQSPGKDAPFPVITKTRQAAHDDLDAIIAAQRP